MSKYTRFIDGSEFSNKKSIEEFTKIIHGKYKFNFFKFDKSGITGCCYRPESICEDLFEIELPDDPLLLKQSKQTMKEALELHINKEIDIEIEKIRPEIEKKVRDKYYKFKPDSSEDSSV